MRMMPAYGEPFTADALYGADAETFEAIRCSFATPVALLSELLPGGIDAVEPGLVLVEYRSIPSSERIAGRAYRTLTVSVQARLAAGLAADGTDVDANYVLARWCTDPSLTLIDRELLGLPTHAGEIVEERLSPGLTRIRLAEFGTSVLLLDVSGPAADGSPGSTAHTQSRQLLGWKWITSAYSKGCADVDVLTRHVQVEDGQRTELASAHLTIRDPGRDLAPVSSRIAAGLARLDLTRTTSAVRVTGTARMLPERSAEFERPS